MEKELLKRGNPWPEECGKSLRSMPKGSVHRPSASEQLSPQPGFLLSSCSGVREKLAGAAGAQLWIRPTVRIINLPLCSLLGAFDVRIGDMRLKNTPSPSQGCCRWDEYPVPGGNNCALPQRYWLLLLALLFLGITPAYRCSGVRGGLGGPAG